MRLFSARGPARDSLIRFRRELCRRGIATNSQFFQVSEEVRDAVLTGRPVVALESTIYTHGFPYPDNIALSSRLESIVRSNGGIPATVGVLNGIAKVGLQPNELTELLEPACEQNTLKVSRRDLGYMCGLGMTGRKLNGGTTIAGTMVLAHLAGIKIFATGGLGGVHQGGENSLDISADLTELGRTPVALISSGCKSFLDIPRTLEYLETQGVGVGTFADGRRGPVEFPAFWTRESGIPSPTIIRNEEEAAAIIYAQLSLALSSGLCFANPIPEKYSLGRLEMDEIMARAIDEARVLGISGSDNTPFVLAKIRELTKGSTVIANRALVEANIARGTKVAVELAKLELKGQEGLDRSHRTKVERTNSYQILAMSLDSDTSRDRPKRSSRTESQIVVSTSAAIEDRVSVVVAGSLAIDTACNYHPIAPASKAQVSPGCHTSNPAAITQRVGGVGHNVSTALHYLSCPGYTTCLYSAIGDDLAGEAATNAMRLRGMRTDCIETIRGRRTAQYVAFNDTNQSLVMSMADMVILEGRKDQFNDFWKPRLVSAQPKWLVVDANWDHATLQKWVALAREIGAKVAYEPVSVEKSTRALLGHNHNDSCLRQSFFVADLATPNELELHAMYKHIQQDGNNEIETLNSFIGLSDLVKRTQRSMARSRPIDDQNLIQRALVLLRYIPCILIKLGSSGVLLTEILRPGDCRLSSPDAESYISGQEYTSSDFAATGRLDELSFSGFYVRYFPAFDKVPQRSIISVNGVGDTFLGTIVAGLVRENPKSIDELVHVAQCSAVMTLKSEESVSPSISSLRSRL